MVLAHGSNGVEVGLEIDEKQAQDPGWQKHKTMGSGS
jgi:hypothetical protein